MRDRDEVLRDDVLEVLEEMYKNSYPSISFKQVLQDAKEGKEIDKNLLDHHYLPKDLFKSILEQAEYVFGYESYFKNYSEHFADYILNGGHMRDIDNWGKDNYKDYKNIEEEIGKEAYEILKKRIDAYLGTFRFDWSRNRFSFNISNQAPSCNRETVINYWKSQGVDLHIPSDEEIILSYYDEDED